MPAAVIIAAISAAVAAAGTGYSIYEGTQQGDAQKNALAAQQKLFAQQQAVQRREAFQAASGNAQAQTGGSLTGQAGQSFADVLAGLPSNYNPAGLGQGTQPVGATSPVGATNAPPNYQQALSAFNIGGQQPDFQGGFQTPNPPNQGRFNLSSMNLG